MFNWGYFWINMAIGGAAAFIPFVWLFGVGYAVWTGYTFGIEWGALAFVEQILGRIAAMAALVSLAR